MPNDVALKHNCVFIMQACRGTGWSEGGVFHPSDKDVEKNDAEDLFAWLEKQPWFNGRCAMFGGSYPGWVQWCAMRGNTPSLVGTSPRVAPLYSCCGAVNPNGGMAWRFPVIWPLSMHHRRTYGYAGVPDYHDLKVLDSMPILDADKFVYGKKLPVFHDFMLPANDPGTFLKDYRKYFDSIRVPAFIAGGWFDGFKSETIESFQLMKSRSATLQAKKFTRLTIGPWGHGGLLNPELFGAENNYDKLFQREEKFLFGLLDDPSADPLPDSDPAVRFFMLGENRWYDTADWPPPECENAQMYLHSGGNANSSAGDGVINAELPGQELPDTYISDPANPVTNTVISKEPVGCYDRSCMEKRADMLIYTSEKFSEPLCLTGKVKLAFYASASTPDTDFFATLTDITPDGRSMLLTGGMIRARYRNTLDKEELLAPGEIYHYEIDLGDIAVKFMPGHAMRLELHGQEFPAFARNCNTGKPVLTDTEMRTSTCTIFHDAEHPAELHLPVNKNF